MHVSNAHMCSVPTMHQVSWKRHELFQKGRNCSVSQCAEPPKVWLVQGLRDRWEGRTKA